MINFDSVKVDAQHKQNKYLGYSKGTHEGTQKVLLTVFFKEKPFFNEY